MATQVIRRPAALNVPREQIDVTGKVKQFFAAVADGIKPFFVVAPDSRNDRRYSANLSEKEKTTVAAIYHGLI